MEIDIIFYPLLSDPFGETEGNTGFAVFSAKYKLLSEEDKVAITSNYLAGKINDTCLESGLSRQSSMVVSALIRKFFFSELSGSVLVAELKKNLNNTLTNDQIISLRDKIVWIINEAKNIARGGLKTLENKGKNEEKAKISKLTITEAIRQYPKIAEQPITGSPIRLKSFPAPARPSVKNWIADYRETLGAERHGMVERGNYLFQSANTRKISSVERQKLAWVLKSMEENTPLDINTESEIIIFPESVSTPSPHPLPDKREGDRIVTPPPVQDPVFRPFSPKPKVMSEISYSPDQSKSFPETEMKKPEPPKIFPPSPRPLPDKGEESGNAEEKKVYHQKIPMNRINPIGDFDEENGNVVNLKS